MKICSILLFTAMTAISAFSQNDLKSVTPSFKPGATLGPYRVQFNGDPQFTSVDLRFDLSTPAQKDQPSLLMQINIDHFAKVKAGVYDVDGTIPSTISTGDYQLSAVVARISDSSKVYPATTMDIKIRVTNDAKYDFPPLKSVTPK